MARIKVQLSDTAHRLSQLQTFRTSVARLLHLRDVPHAGILQRLQTLCNAHQVGVVAAVLFVNKSITKKKTYHFARNSLCFLDDMNRQRLQSASIRVRDTTI